MRREKVVEGMVRALGDRVVEAIVSTGSVDRERDVIRQDGWRLDAYRRNPVILLAHDTSQLPVARATAVTLQGGDALTARMEFPPAGVYPVADTVRTW